MKNERFASGARRIGPALLAFAAALMVAGCSDDTLIVQGLVTNAETGEPLPGVHVALLSADKLGPQTTDGSGFFMFEEVVQTDGVVLTYALEGFHTVSVELEPLKVSVDGATGGDEERTAINASVQLFPIAPPPVVETPAKHEFVVGGWVYAGDVPASGAKVALLKVEKDASLSTYIASTNTSATGRFDLPNIPHGDYKLRVWPFDGNGDGVAEYRLYSRDLYDLGIDGRLDLTNQVIVLEQPSQDLLAGVFTGLSTIDATRPRGYPVRVDELEDGVTSVVRNNTAEVWLHWGGEVDTELAGFELRKIDDSGRASPPIVPLVVTWEHNIIAHIRPPAPFVADVNEDSRYELRITSLRFRTGLHPFSPDRQDYGSIQFAVQSRPDLLGNPTPVVFTGNRRVNAQAAVRALVDAAGLWLIDDQGDYVGGYSSAQHWTDATGFQLSWPHIQGAAGYRVYARNTTSSGVIGDDRSEWMPVEYTLTQPVSPTASNRTIVATGVMRGDFWAFGAYMGGIYYPWLFQNGVSLAVTSVDVDGFESPIDPTKVLTLTDNADPMIESGTLDWRGGTGGLGWTAMRGAAFKTVLRLRTSEPVLPAAQPTFAPVGGAIAAVQAGLVSWDTATQTTPANNTREFAVPVNVRLRGTCTEITLDRHLSDTLTDRVLVVRDRAVLGANTQAVIVMNNGSVLAQVDGLEALGSGTTDLRFGTLVGVTGDVYVPAGSQLCGLGGRDVAHVQAVNGADLTVDDASMFALGMQVAVLEPATCTGGTCTAAAITSRMIIGIDTAARTVQFNAPVPAAFTTTSLVFAWSSATQTLRPASTLNLLADVFGAADVALHVSGASDVRIGDSIRIDGDGYEETTPDQRIVTVKQITSTPTGVNLIVDLPDGTIVVRQRATVVGLGDALTITGLTDTSGRTINKRRNSVTGSGGGLLIWGTNK